jgi:hypothetical protein
MIRNRNPGDRLAIAASEWNEMASVINAHNTPGGVVSTTDLIIKILNKGTGTISAGSADSTVVIDTLEFVSPKLDIMVIGVKRAAELPANSLRPRLPVSVFTDIAPGSLGDGIINGFLVRSLIVPDPLKWYYQFNGGFSTYGEMFVCGSLEITPGLYYHLLGRVDVLPIAGEWVDTDTYPLLDGVTTDKPLIDITAGDLLVNSLGSNPFASIQSHDIRFVTRRVNIVNGEPIQSPTGRYLFTPSKGEFAIQDDIPNSNKYFVPLSGFLQSSVFTDENGYCLLVTNGDGRIQLAVEYAGIEYIDQEANSFFAGPESGQNAAPAFRKIVVADLPIIPWDKVAHPSTFPPSHHTHPIEDIIGGGGVNFTVVAPLVLTDGVQPEDPKELSIDGLIYQDPGGGSDPYLEFTMNVNFANPVFVNNYLGVRQHMRFDGDIKADFFITPQAIPGELVAPAPADTIMSIYGTMEYSFPSFPGEYTTGALMLGDYEGASKVVYITKSGTLWCGLRTGTTVSTAGHAGFIKTITTNTTPPTGDGFYGLMHMIY